MTAESNPAIVGKNEEELLGIVDGVWQGTPGIRGYRLRLEEIEDGRSRYYIELYTETKDVPIPDQIDGVKVTRYVSGKVVAAGES